MNDRITDNTVPALSVETQRSQWGGKPFENINQKNRNRNKGKGGKRRNVSYFAFWPDLIATVLLFVLFAVKLFYINQDVIKLSVYSFVFAMWTLLLTGTVCLILRLLRRRHDHMTFLIVFYMLFSVLLLIDAVYGGYVGKLPSVLSLKYAGQLTDVTDAIKELITPKRLLLVADVIPWLLWCVWLRPWIMRRKKTAEPHRHVHIISAVLAFMIVFAGGSVGVTLAADSDFSFSYLKNEIATYHVLDLYNALFGSNEEYQYSDLAEAAMQQQIAGDANWGVAAGQNVIVLQVEALQSFVINETYNGQEITPNINAFLRDSTLQFENHFYQIGGGNTADAEFTVNNSLYAPESESAYDKYTENDYYGLPWILKENGYSTHAFHGYTGTFWNREAAYPYQGIDHFVSKEDFAASTQTAGMMGISDEALFDRVINDLSVIDEPFYSLVITLSTHYPYWIEDQYRTLSLYAEDEGTTCGYYLQSVNYFDRCFGQFIQQLKDEGLYDNTTIVLYGDHVALPVYDDDYTAFMDKYFYPDTGYSSIEAFQVPLLIHVPGIESRVISTASGHIDVLPTLLHLMGINNTHGIMMGQDLMITTQGLVLEQTHIGRGSYFTNDKFFLNPNSDIFATAIAYDIQTHEILDKQGCYAVKESAKETIKKCMYILDNNLVCELKAEVDSKP